MRNEPSRSRIESSDLHRQVGQHPSEIEDIRNESEQQRKEIINFQEETGRQPKELRGLEAGNDRQREKDGTLEGEKSRLEAMTPKQTSEMQSLRAEEKRPEDGLKGSI
jgi:predicted nuclease with TOPRIM domain